MAAQHIASDLVANVHSVAVRVGQKVEAGEELVLLESMKMEIPVLADRSGRVLEVKVAAGDVVQGLDQISVAMGQGALAATRAHNWLREQDRHTLQAGGD